MLTSFLLLLIKSGFIVNKGVFKVITDLGRGDILSAGYAPAI